MSQSPTALADVLGCCAPFGAAALDDETAQDAAKLFAALGDPTRLRVFSMIASGGEVCSCSLEQPTGRSQSTVSHHTKVLADAGLIVGERRGRWTWWRAEPNAVRQLARLLTP